MPDRGSEALLGKFRGFVSDPLSGDAADPAAGGEGENNVTRGGAPSAGDGDVQGCPAAILPVSFLQYVSGLVEAFRLFI